MSGLEMQTGQSCQQVRRMFGAFRCHHLQLEKTLPVYD